MISIDAQILIESFGFVALQRSRRCRSDGIRTAVVPGGLTRIQIRRRLLSADESARRQCSDTYWIVQIVTRTGTQRRRTIDRHHRGRLCDRWCNAVAGRCSAVSWVEYLVLLLSFGADVVQRWHGFAGMYLLLRSSGVASKP